MKNCIICGSKTNHPLFDFCEECFAMSIEEIEKRYLEKRASETGKDQREAPADREPSRVMSVKIFLSQIRPSGQEDLPGGENICTTLKGPTDP